MPVKNQKNEDFGNSVMTTVHICYFCGNIVGVGIGTVC